MNKEHPNITVLRRLDLNNIIDTSEVLAENLIFHFFNPNLLDIQGDYVGIDGFQKFFNQLTNRSNGTFKVNPVTAAPVGDELVVHSKNTMTLDDQNLEVDAVVIWRIIAGKIEEVWDIPSEKTVKTI